MIVRTKLREDPRDVRAAAFAFDKEAIDVRVMNRRIEAGDVRCEDPCASSVGRGVGLNATASNPAMAPRSGGEAIAEHAAEKPNLATSKFAPDR
jgi:hypothetical protein